MATNPSAPAAKHWDEIGRWEPESLITQLQESLQHGDDAAENIQPLLLSESRGFFANWLNSHTGERGGLTPGQVVLLSAGDAARDLAYCYASDALHAGHPTLMVTPRINPSRVILGIAAQHLPMARPPQWGGAWPLEAEEFAEHNLKEWLMMNAPDKRLALNLPHLMEVINGRLLQVAPTAGISMVTPIGLARLAQEFADEVASSEGVSNRVSLLVLNQLEGVARAGHLSGTEARLEAVELLARHAYNSNMALLVVADNIDAELHALADFSLTTQKMRKIGGDIHGGSRYDVVEQQGPGGGMSVSALSDIMGSGGGGGPTDSMAGAGAGGNQQAGADAGVEQEPFRISCRDRADDDPESILVWSYNDGLSMPAQEAAQWQDGGSSL